MRETPIEKAERMRPEFEAFLGSTTTIDGLGRYVVDQTQWDKLAAACDYESTPDAAISFGAIAMGVPVILESWPQWDSIEARTSVLVEGAHRWVVFHHLVSCLWCMRVRNATSDERPCPGRRGKVALR